MDLSSLTRDGTCTPCTGKVESQPLDPHGKSPHINIWKGGRGRREHMDASPRWGWGSVLAEYSRRRREVGCTGS